MYSKLTVSPWPRPRQAGYDACLEGRTGNGWKVCMRTAASEMSGFATPGGESRRADSALPSF